jgi:phosphoenolpyruvate---glycerone phosphotransferase subunit DhaL
MNSLDLLRWLRTAAAAIASQRDELTALDAAIGDADHGLNMDRGFQAVLSRLDNEQAAGQNPGELAKAAAMVLISTVGGASGPLYGTFFLRFGVALGAASEFDGAQLVVAFRAGLEGLQQRGKASLGDKTMLDAISPACLALEAAVAAGRPLGEALAAAAEAARLGMLGTTALVARKGRASYLGERSRGHQDPGATSSYLIVAAAAVAFVAK